jgi:protein phosphatase 1 regulatory subunit 11
MPISTAMASPAGTTRTATPTQEGGSRTLEVQPQPVLRLSAPAGVLRLRAVPAERRRIQWAEDVIDNEGMGKKSSKGMPEPSLLQSCFLLTWVPVCCIYHKPRAADESSDDDSSGDSSSDSDSDSEPDNSTARPSGRNGGPRGRRPHEHEHGDCEHEHDHGEDSGKPQKRTRPRRKPSPNAYEKMPKNKK